MAKHVRAEIERINEQIRLNHAKHSRVASFLVGPHIHQTERRLNIAAKIRPQKFDVEREVASAISAISAGQVIMLFNDREVVDLDADLTLTGDSSVIFLRLMPLVGG